MTRPLSPHARECYHTIGARLPARTRAGAPIPPLEHSEIYLALKRIHDRLMQVPVFTEEDYQRHIRGLGPSPWG